MMLKECEYNCFSWLDCMFDERTLPIQRKCLLRDIIRDDGSTTCEDCEYNCFSKHCIPENLDVLK